MKYIINDRVVLQTDLESYGKKVSAGTICTIVTKPKQDELIILKGWSEESNKEVIFGVNQSIIRKVTLKDLKDYDYKKLVSSRYHIGESFKTNIDIKFDNVESESIGKIVNIILSDNELRDVLYFEFDGKQYEFEREFVDNNFKPYDEENENMLGNEVVLKGAARNYHIPGARMILQSLNEFVILSKDLGDNKFEVETMQHDKIEVSKEDLMPMLNIENFLQYPEEDKVQQNYTTGNVLVANEDIAKHSLLNKSINPNDIIEIVNVDCSNINAFEDIYLIAVNEKFDNLLKITYLDLKRFFNVFNMVNTSSNDEELDMSIFEKKDEDEDCGCGCKECEEESSKEISNEEETFDIPIIIHDLSILDHRFSIEDGKFSFHEKRNYEFSEIDDLVKALLELKKIGKYN